MKILNKTTALELLHQNMQNMNLRRHCYAVGKALRALRGYYVSQGREVGTLADEEWEIIGILHDSDWEITSNEPGAHTIMLLDWLKDYNAPNELLDVFRSHNNKVTKLREPQTLLEWTLECVDELTGFIVAVVLIRSSRKFSDVDVESVLKKFKQKEFARAVHREQITQCEKKVDIPVEKFVEITLGAMRADSDLLGL